MCFLSGGSSLRSSGYECRYAGTGRDFSESWRDEAYRRGFVRKFFGQKLYRKLQACTDCQSRSNHGHGRRKQHDNRRLSRLEISCELAAA